MIYKQNPSKKALFLLFTLLLSAFYAIGMADAFQLKYYGSHWEDTIRLDGMQGIPSYYFEGIKVIRVYERSCLNATGRYYPVGIIELYNNVWDKEVIIEELAHHCQMQRKDTWQEGRTHSGHFYECYREIKDASN